MRFLKRKNWPYKTDVENKAGVEDNGAVGKDLDVCRARCRDLKKMMYNELMCSNYSESEYIEYDIDDDALAEDVFEPMFDIIISTSLNKNAKEISEQIASLMDEYGVGDRTHIDKVASKLIESQSELRELFPKAKAEMAAQRNYENSPLKKLSDELDEYLRIGEKIGQERSKL